MLIQKSLSLFVLILICGHSFLLNAQADRQFILISYVGDRNYYVAPILISSDTIKKIEFVRGIYDQYIKYELVHKYVISEEHFNILFNNLNIFRVWRKRTLRFLDIRRNECGVLMLIVDFRGKDGKDYELVSLRTYYETLLF